MSFQNQLIEFKKMRGEIEKSAKAEVATALQTIADILSALDNPSDVLNDEQIKELLSKAKLIPTRGPTPTGPVRKPRAQTAKGKGGGRKSKNTGRVIEFLRANGETSQGEIGKKLKIAGISPLMRIMSGKGLVKSRKDGKKVMWSLK